MMHCPAAGNWIFRAQSGSHAAARFPKDAPVQALLPTRHGGGVVMTYGSGSIAQAIPRMSAPASGASRTRLLLEGPIVSTLLRLAAPNIVVNVVLIAVTATVDAHFVGQIGPSALAGISLVFPLIMLMQQMANSSMGGAIASAIARAIGAGRH